MDTMMLVTAWIVSLGVAVCVGMWIERRRSGALLLVMADGRRVRMLPPAR